MTWLAVLASVAILIGLNALYVTAEFATVSSARWRLAQKAAGGDRLAAWLLPVVSDHRRLDAYVATCQVGITASSLVLGFFAQARISDGLAHVAAGLGVAPQVAASATAVGVLLGLTGLQVVMGELVPKNVALRDPERLAILTAIPMRWSSVALRPVVALLNGSGQLLMRVLGLTPETPMTHIHRPEEIVILAEESSEGGLLDRTEQRLLENALTWRELTVGEAMVPRTRMLMAPADASAADMLAALAASPHSRLPLYGGSPDDLVGVLHLKDLLCLPEGASPRDAAKAVRFVPATARAADVFAELRRAGESGAFVLDEHGGTAGMITLDDLVEVLFGEIRDEFDDEAPAVRLMHGGRRALVRGDVSVRRLNEWLDLALPGEDADSLGGLVWNVLGRSPMPGDVVDAGGVPIRVEAMDGRAVRAVSFPLTARQAARLVERRG
jgi:CBS domain containing-hemolysin-like protein